MKRLEITEIAKADSYNGEMVIFKITKQTHIDNEFGRNGLNHFESKDAEILLVSSGQPEIRRNAIHVQGYITSGNDTLLAVSTTYFEQIKRAVAEYNEAFKDDAAIAACPWCGSECLAEYEANEFRVHCTNMEIYCATGPVYLTKEEAITAWNAVVRKVKSK